MTGQVVLVHGLWYRRPIRWYLQRRLQRAGYATRVFTYPTRQAGVAEQAAALRAFLAEHPSQETHFVAHSLGGLIVLQALADAPHSPGRVVLLGSPIGGSRVATRMRRFTAGRWLLGAAVDDLHRGCSDAPACLAEHNPVGMIAGVAPLGLGQLTGGVRGASDGTVAVAETRAPGLADHCEVPASHFSLLFSPRVASEVEHFLANGRFTPR